MAPPRLDRDQVSIVLVGKFNPSIFQPRWFSSMGLLRADEAEGAEASERVITHPDVAEFSADWLNVLCMRERLQVQTRHQGRYQELRDLVIGVLKLLEHTPTHAVGLNRDMHWTFETPEESERLLELLAPTNRWTAIVNKPELQRVTMTGVPLALRAAREEWRVEPSVKVAAGVYVHVNTHYDMSDLRPEMGLLDILDKEWDPWLEESREKTSDMLGRE